MPIDTSIYSMLKPVPTIDPLESYGKAVKLRDLVQQGDLRAADAKRKEMVRTALSKNVTQGPNGKFSLNKPAALSDLYKADGFTGMEAEQKFQQMDAQKSQAQREEMKQKMEIAGDLLWGMVDEQSYQANLAKARELGMPGLDAMPRNYDKSFIDQRKMSLLGAQDQLKQKNQERKFELKEKEIENGINFKNMFGLSDLALKQQAMELNQQKLEADRNYKNDRSQIARDRLNFDKNKALTGKNRIQLTEAEKAVDKSYAKHYNDFSGQGATNARNTIEQLKKFKAELEAESKETFQSGGGRIGSLLPDVLRTDQSLVWKRDIPAKANLVLKKLFGGQLSDDERKSEAQTYYDDMLGPAENAKKLEAKIKQLEDGYKNELNKARYYEKNKTLSGFASGNTEIQKTIAKKQYSPSRDQTRVIYSDGSVEVLDGKQ